MTFEQTIPVLPARDIAETVAFYRDQLGFEGGFVHGEGEYGGVRSGALELHFWRCENPVVLENCSCRIRVSGVESFYECCQRQGVVHPNGWLKAQPWGTVEFAILDPSGNLI
jgi:catechol 2,3-dioxygenase-like lactoylglutathione lyase family enzyme